MTDWWIRSRYGYGAAQLRLCPDVERVATPAPTLAGGLAQLLAELRDLRAGAVARSLPVAGILVLGALCAAILLSTLSRDATDVSPLEIVLFEPPAQDEPIEEPPQLVPEVPPEVAPPPPAPPRLAKAPPKPEPAPAPPPEPVRVAKLEARPRVEPPRRAPVFEPAPALAAPDAPAPPPLRVPAQRALPRPASRAAPPIAIDAVAPPAAHEPAPVSAIRVERRLSGAPSAPPKPSFAIDAVPADQAFDPDPAAAAASSPVLARAALARPPSAARSGPAAPRLDFVAPAPATRDLVDAPRMASRVAFAAPAPTSEARTSAPGQTLDGVPLSSLAACVSDAEEDALKLDVMAVRGGRGECASAAGRYRLVETKNLNAFLLWVERAPSRKQADRCVELRLALECLRGRTQGRTRG